MSIQHLKIKKITIEGVFYEPTFEYLKFENSSLFLIRSSQDPLQMAKNMMEFALVIDMYSRADSDKSPINLKDITRYSVDIADESISS